MELPLTSNTGTSSIMHIHINNPLFFNGKLVLFCCKFQGSNSGHHAFVASTFYLVNQIPGSPLISFSSFCSFLYMFSYLLDFFKQKKFLILWCLCQLLEACFPDLLTCCPGSSYEWQANTEELEPELGGVPWLSEQGPGFDPSSENLKIGLKGSEKRSPVAQW